MEQSLRPITAPPSGRTPMLWSASGLPMVTMPLQKTPALPTDLAPRDLDSTALPSAHSPAPAAKTPRLSASVLRPAAPARSRSALRPRPLRTGRLPSATTPCPPATARSRSGPTRSQPIRWGGATPPWLARGRCLRRRRGGDGIACDRARTQREYHRGERGGNRQRLGGERG